jgi:NhaP-type Na+/H+ and K+/H+ antiporter
MSILFAGGIGTSVKDIRLCWWPALVLATLGFPIWNRQIELIGVGLER